MKVNTSKLAKLLGNFLKRLGLGLLLTGVIIFVVSRIFQIEINTVTLYTALAVLGIGVFSILGSNKSSNEYNMMSKRIGIFSNKTYEDNQDAKWSNFSFVVHMTILAAILYIAYEFMNKYIK